MVWFFLIPAAVCGAAIAACSFLRARAEGQWTPASRRVTRVAKTLLVLLLLAWSAFALISPTQRFRAGMRYVVIPMGVRVSTDSFAGKLFGLQELDAQTVLDIYTDFLTDGNETFRTKFVKVFHEVGVELPECEDRIDDAAVLAKIRRAAGDPSPDVVRAAIGLSWVLPADERIDVLTALLDRWRLRPEGDDVCEYLAFILGRFNDARIVAPLQTLAKDPRPRLRQAGTSALERYRLARVHDSRVAALAAGSDPDADSVARMTTTDLKEEDEPSDATSRMARACAADTNVPLEERVRFASDATLPPEILRATRLLLLKEALAGGESSKELTRTLLRALAAAEAQTGSQLTDPTSLAAKAQYGIEAPPREEPREPPKKIGRPAHTSTPRDPGASP